MELSGGKVLVGAERRGNNTQMGSDASQFNVLLIVRGQVARQ